MGLTSYIKIETCFIVFLIIYVCVYIYVFFLAYTCMKMCFSILAQTYEFKRNVYCLHL